MTFLNEEKNVVYGVNGPVVTVKNAKQLAMQEMVLVGNAGLVGEVININHDITIIQVYESTTGLKPGEPVASTGSPLSLTLGPGIISGIFDGIQRPLTLMRQRNGDLIEEGGFADQLDPEKSWPVTLRVKPGDQVAGGDIYATCPETSLIEHRLMIPAGLKGEIIAVAGDGRYTLNDEIARLKDAFGREHSLTLCQKWPIRTPRPVAKRLSIDQPLITGQKVIDSLFPIGKGGSGAIPGGFGTGKTMTQHQFAKWSDAAIIVYIACGERGNEITQVLEEFGQLIDPKSGKPLMDRTVIIANTSNMPVAAREASIYTGITLAEYYRDMGYDVALMADSTSRWAEALREISGRLEEMPAEEGFPAYLPSRLSQFYERAGFMKNLNGTLGSVSIIGAVSPQGGDFSEPVTQNTQRFIRCFWELDRQLAYSRHYPAINWMHSYSEYFDDLLPYYVKNVSPRFPQVRTEIISLLSQENELMEIVKLIGSDILPEEQRLIIESARVIRVGFLQQNAFHEIDTYVPLEKQFLMMDAILYLHHGCQELIAAGLPLSQIVKTGIFDKVIRMKYNIPNDQLTLVDALKAEIDQTLAQIKKENAIA